MSISSFNFPTPIKFGAGARKLVAAHLTEVGCKRPLIVTAVSYTHLTLPTKA